MQIYSALSESWDEFLMVFFKIHNFYMCFSVAYAVTVNNLYCI